MTEMCREGLDKPVTKSLRCGWLEVEMEMGGGQRGKVKKNNAIDLMKICQCGSETETERAER